MIGWMLWWIVGTAGAYETDQLTDRHLQLVDMTTRANAAVDARLADAVQATNARLQCRASQERTREVLAREVHARTGAPDTVPERGPVRGQGFTKYSAWMETDPLVDRRSFPRPRRDVFSGVGPLQSFVLATAGTNSTYELAGVRVGSDKPEHFWDLGLQYLERSDFGADPEKAVALGVDTEHGIYGMATSRTFSYADLAANWAGYQWFVRLLTEDSELQLDEGGCVVQVRGFDWAEWVDWRWDEVRNPSLYAPEVEQAVREHLVAHRDEVCASFSAWGEGHRQHLQRAFAEQPEWTTGAPVERHDPYRLDLLCAEPPRPAFLVAAAEE